MPETVSDPERERCGATFWDAEDALVTCCLPARHEGQHFDRGFRWGKVERYRAIDPKSEKDQ